MNNDKLRQAGEKFREAAGLMCEWLSDQFEAITDVFNNMAKAGISANDALDVLLAARFAVCDTGPGNQNIRRNQNGRRYSGGWPSRKR